jgi:hypothetical protein
MTPEDTFLLSARQVAATAPRAGGHADFSLEAVHADGALAGHQEIT